MEKSLCFYPIVNRSEVNPSMPDIFLEGMLVAIQISHGAKEWLTGVRKGFQACGYSLALYLLQQSSDSFTVLT